MHPPGRRSPALPARSARKASARACFRTAAPVAGGRVREGPVSQVWPPHLQEEAAHRTAPASPAAPTTAAGTAALASRAVARTRPALTVVASRPRAARLVRASSTVAT